MKFHKVYISHAQLFDEYFNSFQSEIGDLTFTNIFMWDDYYNFSWTEIDNFLVILAKPANMMPFFYGPIGLELENLPAVIEKMKKLAASEGFRCSIKKAPVKLIEMLTKANIKFESIYERDYCDYIYSVQDLINLSGKKYHAKKNHINKFMKLYGDKFRLIDIDADVAARCWEFECTWYEKRNDKSIGLEYEKRAIQKALKYIDRLKYKGMAVELNGEIKAFTLGEKLNEQMVLIHIEKADFEIEGLYSFINQQFLKNYWSDCLYVNREEDLGKENIRKAKLSYHPIRFAEKYTINFE